jgi:hypothetical protein
MSAQEEKLVSRLAIVLSVIGIAAVVILALHALGVLKE